MAFWFQLNLATVSKMLREGYDAENLIVMAMVSASPSMMDKYKLAEMK